MTTDLPPTGSTRHDSILPYLWMLLGAFSFAVMSTLAHELGKHCDWQLVALARTLLAFVFAATWCAIAGARFVVFRPRTLWLRSISGSISLVCGFYALTHLPVADVLTLTNMFPIWVALLAWPLLRYAPSAGVWVAVVCGVAGVALIQRPYIAAGNFATLVALFSSFTSAVAMIGLHRLQSIDARAIVVHFSGVSVLFCLAALLFLPRRQGTDNLLDAGTLAMLLGMGVSATLGQFLLTNAFTSGPPDKVSVVGLSQVAFGMLFDMVLWGRTFTHLTLLGIALVIAPTAWLLWRRRAPGPAE